MTKARSFEHFIVDSTRSASALLRHQNASLKSKLRAIGFDENELRGHDWRDINLSAEDLTHLDFTGSDMRGVSFKGAYIRGASFTGCKLDPCALEASADYDEWTKLPGSRKVQHRHIDHSYQYFVSLIGHTAPVTGAVALRNGDILSWSEDGTLRLWDPEGVATHTLKGHSGPVTGAISLKDERLLSWSEDGTLRLWDPEGVATHTLKGHSGPVTGAISLKDERLLSWSEDGTLRLWENNGAAIITLISHQHNVEGAHELPNGGFLSWSADGKFGCWSAEKVSSGAVYSNWAYETKSFHDGGFLALSWDGTIHYWGRKSHLRHPREANIGRTLGAFILEDKRIISRDILNIPRLWETLGFPLTELNPRMNDMEGVISLPDHRILSWGRTGSLELWG